MVQFQRTSLLVSVRSAAEADVAVRAGADLIDVKEPRAGALGAASSHVIGQVLRMVRHRVPVSVALGELIEATGGGLGADRLADLPSAAGDGLNYAKMGLAGAATSRHWPAMWRRALERLPPTVSGVAVVYADWQRARAPTPDRVLAESAMLDCHVVLVDTFDKTGGSLVDHWTFRQLSDFVHAARMQGQAVVLGGSLSAATLPSILPLHPEYVAVRGGACGGRRDSAIRADRVAELAEMLRRSERRSMP
ncbi:MAG: (5-formylfuran-3-yl)methyl phosphate synthase [Pirellulales bacterium]